MNRSTLRPKTVRPLAVALGVGMGLSVLAPSPFMPEAAAQFSFGGSRLGSGQDRPARTPSGMSSGSPWTRPQIRIAPIPLPIGPRYDEPVYDDEVERPVRRRRPTEVVEEEPSPRRPPRRVRPKKHATPEVKPVRRAAKPVAKPARREAVRVSPRKAPVAR